MTQNKFAALSALVLGMLSFLTVRQGCSGQWLQTMSLPVPPTYSSIQDITADDFGNLYVLWKSTSAHIIEKRDSSGALLYRFGSDIPMPMGLYSDGGGNVYVQESLPNWPSSAIRKYSGSGTLLKTLTINYNAPYFYADSEGNLFVLQFLAMYSYRIHKYNPSFIETKSLDVGYYPAAIQPTPQKTLYILGVGSDMVFGLVEYDQNLNFIGTINPAHFSSFGGWAWLRTPHIFDEEGQIQAVAFSPYSPYRSSYENPQMFYRLDSSFNIAESQNVPLFHSPTAFDGKRLWYVAFQDFINKSTTSCVIQYLYNRPPAAVQYVGPLGSAGGSNPSRTLSWEPAVDPDGDPIAYQVFFGTDPAHLSLLGETPETSLQTGLLDFGATYYWQVTAKDSHAGIPLLSQPAPVVSFTPHFTQDFAMQAPFNYPNPFRISQGTKIVVPTLSVIDRITISIYSVYQDLVWRKTVGPLPAGLPEIYWNGRDNNGLPIFSGMYIAIVDSPLGRQTTRLLGVR